MDLVVTARHKAPYFALQCMLKREGFVVGAAITFFWKVLWSRLVSEKDVVAKFLLA